MAYPVQTSNGNMKKLTAEEYVKVLEYAVKKNVTLQTASKRLFPDEED